MQKSSVLLSNNVKEILARENPDVKTETIRFTRQLSGNPNELDKTQEGSTRSSIKGRIQGWKMKVMSQATRSCLINSGHSFTSISNGLTKIPKACLCKIDSMLRDFWWGKEEGKGKIYLKSWDSICLPKGVGGLRIKRMDDINRSLIAKANWNVLTNGDRPWVRILKQNIIEPLPLWKQTPPKKS
jgi:hypothetical protein